MENKKYINPSDLNVGDQFIEDPYSERWSVIQHDSIGKFTGIWAEHNQSGFEKFFGDKPEHLRSLIKVA